MPSFSKIAIENFRSIRSQSLDLRALNVFIGANGAGKSNLVQVFQLLREVVAGDVAAYAARKGGASALLHFGGRRNKAAGGLARTIRVSAEFCEDPVRRGFEVELQAAESDALFVRGLDFWIESGVRTGQVEGASAVGEGRTSDAESGWRAAAEALRPFLTGFRVFHFHDTSETAAVKAPCAVDDNRCLREDGGNLAAFLYFLQERHASQFQAITDAVRQVAPFFGKFQLAPLRLSPDKIKLEWTEKGDDAYFNASALSDGTLRFMCLATLLLQPELPPLILLDEPELGLHPAAIVLLSSMLEAASTKTQLIVATQSTVLIDQLKPEHVWTADRVDGASVFRWLGAEDLSAWLDNYSLGELWQKNVFGGRP